MKSFVFLSRSGCLLPFLIVFNLFFGWLFLKPTHWLLLEFILILLFALNAYLLTRKIFNAAKDNNDLLDSADVIDVEGEVDDTGPTA